MTTTINKLAKSEVEIISSISAETLASYEAKALEHAGERMEIPGFRKGKAPVDILKQNINGMMLLEEMAEMAISDAYPKILEESKIDAIGRPEITITKVALGTDLEFKIKTAVIPEMTLPDYKKISKEENAKEENKKEITVEEADVTKVVDDLRKMRAHQSMPAHEHVEGEKHPELTEEQLPKVDEEFVKSFGKFETVEEFTNKIRENVKIEKETAQKDKIRMAIIEKIVADTKCEIPEILINSEIQKMMYKLEADITNMGFKIEDYFKQIGKTMEDVSKEWRADAEKRAMLELIIHNISVKENLKPADADIEKETDQITKMYKDADPLRARAYVEQMLTNEKVFNFLSAQ
ncbi:MAG: Trigger factor [Patescibacteria group bacterium]|nr:Trigger factor [Patescibacteria group bacterium]